MVEGELFRKVLEGRKGRSLMVAHCNIRFPNA